MARAAAKRSATGAAAPRSFLWLQGAMCGGLAVMAPGAALLLATLMALSIAALLIEKEIGRPITRSMLLMSGASTLLPLRHLWDAGGSLDAALDILSNPMVPLTSWAAAGAAWLVSEVWFVVAKQILLAGDDRAKTRLKLEREELVKEWRDVA